MTVRAPQRDVVVVATFGWADVVARPPLASPGFVVLPHGLAVADIRSWATGLRAAAATDVAATVAQLSWPRLEPVLARIARGGATAVHLICVASDGAPGPGRCADTVDLAHLTADAADVMADRVGLASLTTAVVALRGDPDDATAMGRAAVAVDDHVADADLVHTSIQGGTAQLCHAVAHRLARLAAWSGQVIRAWRTTATGVVPGSLVAEIAAYQLDRGLVELVDAYAFSELAVAARISGDVDDEATARIGRLCEVGQLLIDVDLEDIGSLDLDGLSLGESWSARVTSLHIPGDRDAADRGALGSVVPVYRHLLEVAQVHWDRGSHTRLAAIIHLITEYLPHLIAESVLGHALDPARVAELIADPTNLLGSDDAGCAHDRRDRAPLRVIGSGVDDPAAWRGLVRHEWSKLGSPLLRCSARRGTRLNRPGRSAANQPACRNPCALVDGWDTDDVHARARLAWLLRSSPLVGLRHPSPAGHFFGVPSHDEFLTAHRATLELLERRDAIPSGGVPSVDGMQDQRLITDLAALVSAVAGTAVAPGTLLGEVRDAIAAALGQLSR